MTATKTTWTAGPWKVNAIKGNRIIGDETAEGWDKLQINNHNATVATVYRSKDARLIACAPELADALAGLLKAHDTYYDGMPDTPTIAAARAALAKTKGSA
jgi:hypothetical protein